MEPTPQHASPDDVGPDQTKQLMSTKNASPHTRPHARPQTVDLASARETL